MGVEKKKLDACKRKIKATLQFAYLSRCQNRWPSRATKPKDTKVVPPAVAATHRSFYVSCATLSGGEREREKRQRRGQLDRRCILNNFIGTTGCYREVDTVREEEKEDKKNPCDNKIYIIFIRACAFSISSNKKLALERGANS